MWPNRHDWSDGIAQVFFTTWSPRLFPHLSIVCFFWEESSRRQAGFTYSMMKSIPLRHIHLYSFIP